MIGCVAVFLCDTLFWSILHDGHCCALCMDKIAAVACYVVNGFISRQLTFIILPCCLENRPSSSTDTHKGAPPPVATVHKRAAVTKRPSKRRLSSESPERLAVESNNG